jgi:DNA-binding IclR family transcriptional regulator
MNQPREEQGAVRTLDRGLSVLECFDVAHPTWTIADLCRAVGLHKATTRRLVKTLEARRFLVLDETTGAYRLGPTVMPLAYTVRANDELVRIAHPFVEELAARTQESVGLWIWTDIGMVQIDRALTTHPFKPEMLIGSVTRQYGPAFSKLFLAFGPEERLASLHWKAGDDDRPLTVADAATIREELDEIRQTGLAYDLDQRVVKGLCAVAAPIMDGTATMVAAMAVVAPPERFGPQQRDAVASLAKTTAATLSRELGFRDATSLTPAP